MTGECFIHCAIPPRARPTKVKFFHFADESFDVTHAEKFLDEWLGLEGLEVVDVFTRADEDNWKEQRFHLIWAQLTLYDKE